MSSAPFPYGRIRASALPAWSAPADGRHRRRRRSRRGDLLATLVDVLDRDTPADVDPVAFAALRPGTGDGDPRPPLYQLDAGDLLGWRAPDEVVALAVVASGHARALDEAGERGHAGGPVRLVVAVGRDGGVAGRFTLDGRVHDEPPAAGRLFDTLRRSLGLGTEPPPSTTLPLVTNLWLSAVLTEAARLGRPLDWPEALRLHPAGVILADDPAGIVVAGDAASSEAALAAVIAKTAELWDWETTRRVAAEVDCLSGLCPSELARWMDEGMFARWVLDELLPLPALLDRAEAALTPGAAGAVRRAVQHDRSRILG